VGASLSQALIHILIINGHLHTHAALAPIAAETSAGSHTAANRTAKWSITHHMPFKFKQLVIISTAYDVNGTQLSRCASTQWNPFKPFGLNFASA
jgi:hypothetical protein